MLIRKGVTTMYRYSGVPRGPQGICFAIGSSKWIPGPQRFTTLNLSVDRVQWRVLNHVISGTVRVLREAQRIRVRVRLKVSVSALREDL